MGFLPMPYSVRQVWKILTLRHDTRIVLENTGVFHASLLRGAFCSPPAALGDASRDFLNFWGRPSVRTAVRPASCLPAPLRVSLSFFQP